MRVLAIGAHPDDLEIACGGTLAKYAKRGDEVFMCCATDGSAGHMLIPPVELKTIREKEARAAAEVIGAQIKFLEYEDEWLFHDRPTRLKFVDMIRWADPQVIITHVPDDYHPDHRACSELVFGASFVSTLPNIKTEHAAQSQLAAIFYMDKLAGVRFAPEFYVDVTDTFETKRDMLSRHESQVKWLCDHDSIDIMELIGDMAKMRGLQCSTPLAEGFTAAWAYPRITPARLLP